MRNTFTYIEIQQVTNGRDRLLKIPFCNSVEIKKNWTDLTNSGKIVLPKRLSIKDNTNNTIATNIDSQKYYISNVNNSLKGDALFMIGDYITIKSGYQNYYKTILEAPVLYQGWITNIKSSLHTEILLEDNMWLFKQLQAPTKYFGASLTLLQIISQCYQYAYANSNVDMLTRLTLANIQFEGADTSITYNINTFRTNNETIAEVLDRIKKEYHLDSFFRNSNTLHIGIPIYNPTPTTVMCNYSFNMDGQGNSYNGIPYIPLGYQELLEFNVINIESLTFTNKEDINLSALCSSVVVVNTGKTNKDGTQQTTKDKLKILIYYDKTKQDFNFIDLSNGAPVPSNTGGERRSFIYNNINNVNQLYQLGLSELKKYYYSGFKGSFDTFLYPIINFGDVIYLHSQQLPERDGFYVVRSVEYKNGTSGARQNIELDYILNI